uniref:Myosin motor domain-containing protein n=1 Tax=Salarias fasciatus TaxID=181472 RepID=A0A672IU00_SALFA
MLDITLSHRHTHSHHTPHSDPPSDLCALPELTERALLESLRARFRQEKIYTYIGSILIVINPFQFCPSTTRKYVKLYDNHTLGKLEPHIYAVADVAYHAMLQRRKNQCISRRCLFDLKLFLFFVFQELQPQNVVY